MGNFQNCLGIMKKQATVKYDYLFLHIPYFS